MLVLTMLFSLLFVIIGILAILDDSIVEYSISITCAIVAGLIFGVLIFGTAKLNKMPYNYPEKPQSIEYIIALSDNSEINGVIYGSRYAVRGYFNEILYYSYMVKLKDGGAKANKIQAENTTVYETDNDFRVEWYTASKEFWGMKQEYTYWKLYVPKGSIANEFSIDLQ